ncbi:MAG: transposase [Thiohalocapsa sp.]
MSRPLRIELAGGLYHVTARGDRREPIYRVDADRTAWLTLFGEVCERFNWRCHGWCQMTNHYHFAIETPDANLSAGMRQLNGVYTQYFNRVHRLVGHLFQGRFKAILVEREAYLLELSRYVVLNPVRAHMVGQAGDWPWSSYRAMMGLTAPPTWLETDWVLGQFATDRSDAQTGFAGFVAAGVGQPSPWTELRHQIFLGSAAFVEQTVRDARLSSGELREVPRAQRRTMARSLEWF